MNWRARQRGATFIDAVVGTALMLLVFLGLFGVIRLALLSVGLGKAKTGAIALATEQIEFVRSLSYNNVAVVGGIPAGTIPQVETVTLNNVPYTRRTFVQFIDAEADGIGGDDENGIPADYKIAKVDVSWQFQNVIRTVSLITNVVPKGIETVEGGGTLALSVVDAAAIPVSGASIHIVNTTVSPGIDLMTYTGVSGLAYLPGAPTSTGYQITVTKAGHSTDKTYTATTTNPNPNPGHLTVVEDTITSSTFRIDLLGSILVRSFDPIRTATWTDPFVDISQVESQSGLSVGGGTVALFFDGAVYTTQGLLTATTVAPTYLFGWKQAEFIASTPASTTVEVSVEYDTGTGYASVPDAVLPGNAAGFVTSPIDLSSLATSTYARLRLGGDFRTSNTSETPTLSEWSIIYDEGPIPKPGVAFMLRGAKTIGTDGGGLPIYKYQSALTTDAEGVFDVLDIEWDAYTLTLGATETGLSVFHVCPFIPFGLAPGAAQTVDVILVPQTTNTLLVSVLDDVGIPLPDASVHLTKTGYDTTVVTSACGQSFFENLQAAATYTLDVSALGHDPYTILNVSISGQTTVNVVLNAS
ncbi:MAG: carboxypeptidase-like regulatory domain-containing protein [Patescibacteria group bacterium]